MGYIKKGYMSQGTKQSEYAKVFEKLLGLYAIAVHSWKLIHMDSLLLKGRELVIPPWQEVVVDSKGPYCNMYVLQ